MTEPAAPAEITDEMLGTFEGADAPPAAVATPAAEPVVADPPAPEPEPAAVVAEPEPDADESMTLDELTASLKTSLAEAISDIRKAEAAAPDPDDETPPEVVALKNEKAALEAKVAALENQQADAEEARVVADIDHQIKSAVGKYKMTAAEQDEVVIACQDRPTLFREKGFEAVALSALPHLRDRIRATPAPQKALPGGEGADGLVTAPTANGAGAPSKWKHTPNPGDYSDITKHMLQSGEAAGLGKYD